MPDSATLQRETGSSESDIRIIAAALRRTSEDTSTAAQLRKDSYDAAWQHLISIDDRELKFACATIVNEGLPEDPRAAERIIKELLQRFELSRSELLGKVGIQLMESMRDRYGMTFESLREFEYAARKPDELIPEELKLFIHGTLDRYDNAVAPVKEEYLRYVRSVGIPVSDNTLAKLSCSELEDICDNYLRPGYEKYMKSKEKFYRRLVAGERLGESELEEFAKLDRYFDNIDAMSNIRTHAEPEVVKAAQSIATLVKKAESNEIAAAALSMALARISGDYYLSLEVLFELFPDKGKGQLVMGSLVTEIARDLNSGEAPRVFLARRKLRDVLVPLFKTAATTT